MYLKIIHVLIHFFDDSVVLRNVNIKHQTIIILFIDLEFICISSMYVTISTIKDIT